MLLARKVLRQCALLTYQCTDNTFEYSFSNKEEKACFYLNTEVGREASWRA
jgi:hypothetical protein